MTSQLPTHHQALVLESIGAGLQLKNVPVPHADLGAAVIRVEAASVLSYHREVYNGDRQYTFPTPLVGGFSAIGRIVALGPDATTLKLGQLVYVDCDIHARDDPNVHFLLALHDSGTPASRKLFEDVWRDGPFAEYVKMPLENCISLDETRLCTTLGYSIRDLLYMAMLVVPFGGLRDIKLEPGETVIVSPATGGYGGAGVQVAIAMGARVIAMGRNETELARLKAHILKGSPKASIETMKMTGDELADAETLKRFGTIDAVLDFTPPQGSQSPHLKSAMRNLRRNGRISLMGFSDSPIVPWIFVAKNISLKGKLMYEREDIIQFVKMLEAGLFPKGKDFVDTKGFQLQDWNIGFDTAATHTGVGKHVVLTP